METVMHVPRTSALSSSMLRASRLVLLLLAAIQFLPEVVRAEETPVPTPEQLEFFEKEVRPVLADNCLNCHGPKTQWATLRLDSRSAVLTGGDSGPAIVPGNPDESELIYRLEEEDDSLRMPPAETGKKLTEHQISAIKQWVREGAPWPASPAADEVKADPKQHWAFQPISSPAVPEVSLPDWPRTPVDNFVLSKLEEKSLRPSDPADRRTLIRRATYGLTGLPPTAAEVEAFVSDQSPDAYPRLIERLLASPAYGEHWGRHWLDVARFSDSKGYVYGREERFFVHSSIYRDWVVKALNEDLPYDRFLLLQLAADQAAPEDPPAAAAMGFLTLGRRFLGVKHDIIDDRIDVVTRGTMGLTVSCARCHDHKYDPIPTADYYSLYGVFQNCAEVMVAIPNQSPAQDQNSLSDFQKELEKRKKALADELAASRKDFSDLARKRIGEYLMAQRELEKYPEQAFSQILARTDVLPVTVRRFQRYLESAAKNRHRVFTPWSALVTLTNEEFSSRAAEVLATVDLSPAGTNPRVAAAFQTPPATPQELVDRYAKLFADVEQAWQQALAAAAAQNLPAPNALPDPADEELRQVLYGEDSPCVVPDLPIVNIEFCVDTGTCVNLWQLQSAVDQWILSNPTEAPHAVVLKDQTVIDNPRIFRRGNPTNVGDEVPLRFLEVLSGPDRQPFQRGSGRYELAQAIVNPDNPLTSRVWVNRVWAHHFGNGLVRTPSDFGTRAEAPTHPELLDWLARNFMESGWSTKDLHRKIMLSAAYQQNSHGPSEPPALKAAVDADPENRLLWRMNPRRLSFEELRDTLLAVSDDLDPTMGGKSVNFFAATPAGFRRTLYGTVDRQFLPSVLRVFDFANPDLHSPQRSETTVPQQALFSLNHSFVADRARSLAAEVKDSAASDAAAGVAELYQRAFQRAPTAMEAEAAVAFVVDASADNVDIAKKQAAEAWSYGVGELDQQAGKLKDFRPLPHFTGAAWQGGPAWPDSSYGWAQITATGGHPGDDLQRAIVRRWTAPAAGTYAVASTVTHSVAAGDGVRCWIVSSQSGVLKSVVVHNAQQPMDVEAVQLQAGDTLDFIVDINEGLNSDQHLWSPTVTKLASYDSAAGPASAEVWSAEADFTGAALKLLDPWEQLAHVLLISNELVFVD